MERISESINGVLERVDVEDRTIDALLPHLSGSAEFQKLIRAHVSNFYASGSTIPDRLATVVMHSFWLGFESGKAVEQSYGLESMLAAAEAPGRCGQCGGQLAAYAGPGSARGVVCPVCDSDAME